MLLVLIIALICAGGALALAGRAARLPRIRAEESVNRIGAYGFGAGAAADPPPRASLLPQLAAKLGAAVLPSAGEDREAEIRKLLLSAGLWNTTPVTLLGYRVLAAVASGGLLLWLTARGGQAPAVVVLVSAYGTGLGWLVPMFVVKSRARNRIERVELELPELIDLLVVTLEAGLGFNAALGRAAERMRGPLGQEIRLALKEQSLGLSLDQSLKNMLGRCDAPAVRAFSRAVAQGEAMGISIGQVMRDLAGDLRTRRRQIVQEKAQKAPIKMLFPLAFLILPAIFVVVLFPGLYRVVETLGGGG